MELMARSDRKARRDRPVLLVPRVQLARRERMELTARLDPKVQRGQPVQRVRTELTAQSDRKARRDPSELPALPVPSALPDRTT